MYACDLCLRPSNDPPPNGYCNLCAAGGDHGDLLGIMRSIGIVAADAIDRIERAFWPMPDDGLPMPPAIIPGWGE